MNWETLNNAIAHVKRHHEKPEKLTSGFCPEFAMAIRKSLRKRKISPILWVALEKRWPARGMPDTGDRWKPSFVAFSHVIVDVFDDTWDINGPRAWARWNRQSYEFYYCQTVDHEGALEWHATSVKTPWADISKVQEMADGQKRVQHRHVTEQLHRALEWAFENPVDEST